MTTNTTKPATMVATFPATGNWQATSRAKAYGENTIQLRAVECCYMVVSEFGTWHSGFSTEDNARKFARSMHSKAIVMEVEPYWYCEGWGRVPADAVYAYTGEPDARRTAKQHVWALGCDDATGVGMRPVRIVV